MTHGIRALPSDQLAAIAFEAYQNGMTATHDACIREALRRSLGAHQDHPECRKPPLIDRRGPNRPFTRSIAA